MKVYVQNSEIQDIEYLPILLSQTLIFSLTHTCIPYSLHHGTHSGVKRHPSHTAATLTRPVCFSIIYNGFIN